MAYLATKLEGKTVLVTGASSGIGRGLAIEFAKHGAQIAIVARNLADLETTKELALKDSSIKADQVLLITADLSIAEECQKIVRATVETFGKLDVLVNNAGFLIPGSTETQTIEQYDTQMGLNTRAVFVLTQAAVSHLKTTQGNIVNISSVGGTLTSTGVLGYSVSKAAVNHLTKCTELDLARYNIRCNSVSPTTIRTPILEKILGSEEVTAQFLEQQGKKHALGRVGEIEDVTKAVIFLASNALSGFITGIDMRIDGGISLLNPQQPEN